MGYIMFSLLTSRDTTYCVDVDKVTCSLLMLMQLLHIIMYDIQMHINYNYTTLVTCCWL